MTERQLCALHESGHSVAAILSGVIFSCAQLDPPRVTGLRARPCAFQHLAGVVAERLAHLACDWATVLDAARVDIERAARMIPAGVSPRAIVDATARRISRSWSAVEAVADALEVRDRLGYVATSAIVRLHPPTISPRHTWTREHWIELDRRLQDHVEAMAA
jgi:hypothetical protein